LRPFCPLEFALFRASMLKIWQKIWQMLLENDNEAVA
jgi:hypothetical protein